MKAERRQKTAPGAVVANALNQEIPDDAVPFGDGKRLWSQSEKTLYNAEACVDHDLVAEEDD